MSAPLRVVLEVGLNADAPRGIDYYMANMIEALSQIDPENRYLIFSYFFRDYEKKKARLPRPSSPNFELLVRRFPESLQRLLERRAGLPIVQRALLAGRPIDLYHVLGGGSLPRLTGPKTVVTFFDLACEKFPADGRPPDPGRRIADPYTYELARRADCLLATGDSTKADIVRFYGLPEDKIAVLPTGVNQRIFRVVADPAQRRAVCRRYGLAEKFFMVVGPYDPPQRTNADVTLEAFARIKASGAAAGCSLVLAGAKGPSLDRLLEQARALGLDRDVAAPGYLAWEDLAPVYAEAVAVVHPTSIEGFGFGLEILASGGLFITSDRPGVIEAVADAALIVPPRDRIALEDAMARLLKDEGLRALLRERGLRRAERFLYPAVARRLVGLYERLARGSSAFR